MAKPSYKNKRARPRKPAQSAGDRDRAPAENRRTKLPGKSHGERLQQNAHPTSETPSRPSRLRWTGARLPETYGVVLKCPTDTQYALIDSGDGEKLERYGPLTIRRPEGQALWQKTSPDLWTGVDAHFTGNTEEEGKGRWFFPEGELAETWPLDFDGVGFHGRFTSFRHLGVFPEQAPHWRAMRKAIEAAGRPLRVLNLFGYTGIASLVAAATGAHVTHVDASKKAIGWARENQSLAGLENASIRWICDDAVKFCAREVKREQSYDIILLDPPAYGRGPKGEVWQFFDDVPHLLDLVRQLQSEKPVMTILTSYAIRASSFALHEVMQEVFAGLDGRLESGELVLQQEVGGRLLSTSMFSRFIGADDA